VHCVTIIKWLGFW